MLLNASYAWRLFPLLFPRLNFWTSCHKFTSLAHFLHLRTYFNRDFHQIQKGKGGWAHPVVPWCAVLAVPNIIHLHHKSLWSSSHRSGINRNDTMLSYYYHTVVVVVVGVCHCFSKLTTKAGSASDRISIIVFCDCGCRQVQKLTPVILMSNKDKEAESVAERETQSKSLIILQW